jgi:hypothetical protein
VAALDWRRTLYSILLGATEPLSRPEVRTFLSHGTAAQLGDLVSDQAAMLAYADAARAVVVQISPRSPIRFSIELCLLLDMLLHTRPRYDFSVSRLAVMMQTDPNRPEEAWGVLNPGGVRAPDGTMHPFPRIIADGNYSRNAHARVIFEDDRPVGVERLGMARKW